MEPSRKILGASPRWHGRLAMTSNGSVGCALVCHRPPHASAADASGCVQATVECSGEVVLSDPSYRLFARHWTVFGSQLSSKSRLGHRIKQYRAHWMRMRFPSHGPPLIVIRSCSLSRNFSKHLICAGTPGRHFVRNRTLCRHLLGRDICWHFMCTDALGLRFC
jgi:hypothetical protein